MEEKKAKLYDMGEIVKTLYAKKKLFLIVWAITFVLSCAWIVPQPRYYLCEVSLAPESAEGDVGGLSSLASSMGLNMGGGSSADAIYPQLYPELFESTDFVVSLLSIKVRMKDNPEEMDFYTYLAAHQKINPYMKPIDWVKGLFRGTPSAADQRAASSADIDPFMMNEKTRKIVEKAMKSIKCDYDKTSDIITLSIETQDPLVSALMADSVKMRLQNFIVEYRTKKSRADYEYYCKLAEEAYESFDSSRIEYGRFCDSHREITLTSLNTVQMTMEDDMQQKYELYKAMVTRRDAALAKIQESTPAFTTLKSATVPNRAAGPKRMIFVAFMLVLATLGTSLKILASSFKKLGKFM